MQTHYTQANVAEIPHGKIVSAFGDRKCPKLVEQVADDDIETRVNALGVLCDEFNNPYMVQGCTAAGVTAILAQMITDPDFTTRERASRALAIAAGDALGIKSILEEAVVPEILKGAEDPTVEVRSNIYNCVYHLTRLPEGIEVCVAAGAAKLLVEAVSSEEPACQAQILKTIQNLVKIQRGLAETSFYKGVRMCISLLRSEHESVAINAARALGFICFAEKEKDQAIEEGAVPTLLDILRAEDCSTAVKSAVTSALMSITSTDEGKRQMFPSGGIDVVMRTLVNSKDKIITINTLKLISNCAVFPQSRQVMAQNEDFLEKLRDLCESSDQITNKHAGVALKAVNFKP